nr:hypothetical protein [Tanacetum cinerariifolium]
MIPEPGDANHEITVTETFHLQTDDELSDKELKQIEADDQAIQTILLGFPEDIYVAVDRESIESYYHRFLKLMNDLKRNKHFPEKIAINLKFLNNLQPEWSRHVTIVHQTKDLYTADYTQLYDFLKYNQKKIISSNPRNKQIAQPGMNMGQDRQTQMVGGNGGNQFRQYAGQNAGYSTGYNDVIGNLVIQNAVQNPRVQNVGNQNGLIGVQWNGNHNPIRNGNLVAARAEGNAAGQNGNQIRCYNCRGVEEYDLMAAVADLDEIEEVAPIYDTDGSVEVHENCDDNEIFNMFTQEEQYTELLEPIPESHQVPQNDNDVISEDTSVEQDLNKQLSKEKSIVSFLLEEKKKLKSDFKTYEDDLLDKQIQLEKKIKELNNILLKTGQLIQTIHMLSPKPDSFYHTKQKMALGYQNPFYLKQAQKKQQCLYDEKVLLEKHDLPVVHDSEETLQLAQESREKLKQLNKEIKPANYTKINHLLGVLVPHTTMSREELYFSNNSKTTNVSKSISIPNEDFSDDATPSVARKFLNEVKSTIVTLRCVVKQRMTIKTYNWSSSAHQELHKIVRDEIFPIVNQVDARLQNFEIQFLKEAAKFVGDFKSLANKSDASLAKYKALELEIERLLKAVVS